MKLNGEKFILICDLYIYIYKISIRIAIKLLKPLFIYDIISDLYVKRNMLFNLAKSYGFYYIM